MDRHVEKGNLHERGEHEDHPALAHCFLNLAHRNCCIFDAFQGQ